jgi:uncharacterized protein YceK
MRSYYKTLTVFLCITSLLSGCGSSSVKHDQSGSIAKHKAQQKADQKAYRASNRVERKVDQHTDRKIDNAMDRLLRKL